jgi:hypothetical protein
VLLAPERTDPLVPLWLDELEPGLDAFGLDALGLDAPGPEAPDDPEPLDWASAVPPNNRTAAAPASRACL